MAKKQCRERGEAYGGKTERGERSEGDIFKSGEKMREIIASVKKWGKNGRREMIEER